MTKDIINNTNDLLILVDDHDHEIGVLDKYTVHKEGLLHRAFSVFIFNSKAELLLQQRADNKYHSPGLWTNTCCSHPKPGEQTIDACNRRLMEEMGMHCKLEFSFSFLYKSSFENGLTEHEFDHVYVGQTDDLPIINTEEVKEWKYLSIETLKGEISIHPDRYTVWLKICFPKLLEQKQFLAELRK